MTPSKCKHSLRTRVIEVTKDEDTKVLGIEYIF
jgi:hypothetical protein